MLEGVSLQCCTLNATPRTKYISFSLRVRSCQGSIVLYCLAMVLDCSMAMWPRVILEMFLICIARACLAG